VAAEMLRPRVSFRARHIFSADEFRLFGDAGWR
jgi:hypothetical protein